MSLPVCVPPLFLQPPYHRHELTLKEPIFFPDLNVLHSVSNSLFYLHTMKLTSSVARVCVQPSRRSGGLDKTRLKLTPYCVTDVIQRGGHGPNFSRSAPLASTTHTSPRLVAGLISRVYHT